MSPVLAEIAFEAINLAILGAGLGWLLFRPVRAALEAEVAERARVEAELSSRRAALEADEVALEAARSAHRDGLEAEARDRRRAAEEEAARLLETARAEVKAERASWDTERRLREAEAARREASVAARLAAEAARDLLGHIAGPELEEALARATLAALGPVQAGPVWVEVAHPPGPGVRAALEAALPPGFEVRERSDLIAGLRVGTPAGMVDGSAAGMARRAAGEESGA